MKFENDFFEIVIERKELSEEQKLERKQRSKKRLPFVIVAVILILAIGIVAVLPHFHSGEGAAQETAVNDKSGSTNSAKEKNSADSGNGNNGGAVERQRTDNFC